ncbi:MAG TPA: hypothetical protein VF257_01735 [Solirubrobacteraceae bacterium]
MPWRRVLLLAVFVLVAASALSAMAPRERRFGESPPPAAQPPPPKPSAAVVEATLPSDRAVRARVGDVVRLSVRAPSADVVEVPSLAVEEPVDAGAPAELLFVADRAGRFRVRLRDADQAIGTLHVVS